MAINEEGGDPIISCGTLKKVCGAETETPSQQERRYIDNRENGLYVEAADEDGVHVCESADDNKVYIYFSEIPDLIKILQEYYDNK